MPNAEARRSLSNARLTAIWHEVQALCTLHLTGHSETLATLVRVTERLVDVYYRMALWRPELRIELEAKALESLSALEAAVTDLAPAVFRGELAVEFSRLRGQIDAAYHAR